MDFFIVEQAKVRRHESMIRYFMVADYTAIITADFDMDSLMIEITLADVFKT